ncbi:YfhO family protein [Streptomyces sp. NBC_01142]|uniref:YfhO family protein n=1 Tax=Streptomyces sp. NBC_01142 TaxID=2975865 RepID=UPI00225A5ED4|nr:YfhO family protein [Streptomyces sp. NBC_01142]MCX4823635.1 YfhO family protein [Streptomyces sp. NBC_01142]
MSTLESARGRAAALAALITVGAVCAGDAVARSFPFGPHTRSVNDLGNQFVPFHAHLWDLLHGRSDGGLLLNWQSGYGTSFLPDLGTYLTSPFSLLVGLFPREDIDLAVYVITVLKMATAAAAMTWLLLSLHRDRGGRWWMAGVLGASYALCGWSVVEASYNPMWMDGLIAFPLLCLVGEWARKGRRPVLGPVIVAVAWIANFYTAYMATIGAALILAVRLLLEETEARQRIRALLRATWTVLLGIALAAPVLVPVFLGSRHAYPGWTKEFAPAGWSDVFARALPATYSFFTPAVFIGGGTLLLACALAFHRGVPRRERWVWTGLAAAVALSLQWEPTHLVWHVFATPNGSPYRQTFVFAGILVITAWTGLSYAWPGRRALLGGGAAVAVIALGATASDLVTAWTFPLAAAGLAAAAAGLVLAGRGRFAVLAALLLSGALVGQAAATTAYADRQRLGRLDDYPAWGGRHSERAAAVAKADDWPGYRTDPGRDQITGNDPILMGGQGGSYYSSHTPDVLTRTLAALGSGWTSNGRSLQSLDNPVTDAIFSVGARVRTSPGKDPSVTRAQTPPLLTVRPRGPEPRYGWNPFRNQEMLLGAEVYSSPVAGSCPVGSDVFLWAPNYTGKARLGDAPWVTLRGGQPKRRAALAPLGTVNSPGATVSYSRGNPRTTIGCLDRAKLTAAVDRMKATGAVSVEVGDSGVRAELPPGTTGTAVLAAPRIAGWSCNGMPADSYLGLVAVPLDGTRTTVDCSFRPPGLRAGTAVGAAGLLTLAGLAFLPLVRTRRKTDMRAPSGSDSVTTAA